MDEDDETSSHEEAPALPSGVLRTSTGWAGEELELRHGMEERSKEGFAAVDLEQFRNREVGKGYQARGVVRQQTLGRDVIVRDMTSGQIVQQKESKRQKRERYLQCAAIREFRKELEEILSSETRPSK